MQNNSLQQTLAALALIGIAFFLLNPFKLFMPDMMVMVLMALLLVVFALFASFVLRERAGDEREAQHRMHAGRVAFLVGSGVLMLGIVTQSFTHRIDAWLVLALVCMILAKLGTRFYSDRNL